MVVFPNLSDPCPVGYHLIHTGRCLKHFTAAAQRRIAKSNCEAFGDKLVSMRTREQEDAVRDYKKYLGGKIYLIVI